MLRIIKKSFVILNIIFCHTALALNTSVTYLERKVITPPTLSNLVSPPENMGLSGAKTAITDNRTTGKFLDLDWELHTRIVAPDKNWLASIEEEINRKDSYYFIVNAPTKDLLELASHPAMQNKLIFNVASKDTVLRQTQCRKNILHTIPSRAMLSDALMQFLLKKKWKNLFLISGPKTNDKKYHQALKNSIKKYNLKITQEKQWDFNADIRRSASAEVPVFTQGNDYDTVIITDEIKDFGQYFLYNTWLPRPIAGSHGMTPVAWSNVIEKWGAAQLQSRFKKDHHHEMTSIDYASWAAIRAIGEAILRTNKNDVPSIHNYLFSDKFTLAGYKGRPLTFRPWSGQLRQPIAITHPLSVVAMAPIEGFLHRENELDTLGIDKRESDCNFTKEK